MPVARLPISGHSDAKCPVKRTVSLYVDGSFSRGDVSEVSHRDFEWPARIGAAEFVPNSRAA